MNMNSVLMVKSIQFDIYVFDKSLLAIFASSLPLIRIVIGQLK